MPRTWLDEISARRQDYEDGFEELAVRRVRAPLERARAEAALIVNADLDTIAVHTQAGRVAISPATRQRASAAIQEINGILTAGVDQAGDELISMRARGFLRASQDFAESSVVLNASSQASIASSFSQVSPEAIRVASQGEVLGFTARTQMNTTLAVAKEAVRKEVIGGLASGASSEVIARRLQETLDLTEVAAERITRTNMTAVHNDAQRLMMDASPDIFDGYEWLATLDNVTTQICSSLHGKYFPRGSVTPGPPAHPNCRSILIGVFKDKEVQAIMDGDLVRARNFTKDGKRAADKFVRSKSSFDSWLKSQPAVIQDQVAGSKLRGEMFRRDLMTTQDFIDPLLKPVNNREALRRAWSKNPNDEWIGSRARKAGLDAPVSPNTIAAEDAAKQAQTTWSKPGTRPGKTIDPVDPPAPVEPPKPPKPPEPGLPGDTGTTVDPEITKAANRIQDLDGKIKTASSEIDALRSQLDRAIESGAPRSEITKLNRQIGGKQSRITRWGNEQRDLQKKIGDPPAPPAPKPDPRPVEPPQPKPKKPRKQPKGSKTPKKSPKVEPKKPKPKKKKSPDRDVVIKQLDKDIKKAEAQLQRALKKKPVRTAKDYEADYAAIQDELRTTRRAAGRAKTDHELARIKSSPHYAGSDPKTFEDVAKAAIDLEKANATHNAVVKRVNEIIEKINQGGQVAKELSTDVQAAAQALAKLQGKKRAITLEEILAKALPKTRAKDVDAALKAAAKEMRELGLNAEGLRGQSPKVVLDTLAKLNGQGPGTKLSPKRQAILDRMVQQLRDGGSRTYQRRNSKKAGKAFLKRATKDFEEFLRAMPDSIVDNTAQLDTIEWTVKGGRKVRAHAATKDHTGKTIDGEILLKGNASSGTMFHEFMHHIEAKDPHSFRRMLEWIRKRTAGELPVRTSAGESHIADKFWDSYVGRVYSHNRASDGFAEGLTMVAQTLADKGFQSMLQTDPEHLRLLWTVLRGY